MIESSSVRRALSQVRDEISPTRDDKARLRARILVPAALLVADSSGQGAQAAAHGAVAPEVAAPGAAAVSSLTRWAALKAAGTAAVATGLALLGVGGGVGFWLGHEVASSRAGSQAALEVPAQAVKAPTLALERNADALPASSAPAAPGEAVADVRAGSAAPSEAHGAIDVPRAAVPPRAHAARRRAEPSPINDELALLRRVERALRSNDPALARALLGELDERFPDSRLGEERSAARRIADCRSGEPGASESARAFLREHAASVYRKRIVLACALEGEKGSATPTMTNPERADTHDR
jgi:hypothetical protein